MRTIVAAVLLAAVVGGLLPGSATAAPSAPTPVGTAPVGVTPERFGQFVGQNGSALDSCTVGGRRVVVASGDVTDYRAAQRRRGVARLWLLDADTSEPLAHVRVSGKRVRRAGTKVDGGFVQTVLCRPTSKRKARIYLGGSFTRVEGRERRYSAMVVVTARAGRWHSRVTGWEADMRYPVASLATAPGRVLVAGGGVAQSVSPTSGRARWAVQSSCGGVRAVRYAAGKVYVGGFFNALRGTGGTVARNHALAKVDASTGRVASRRSFRTSIPKNQGCRDYRGANVLAIAHDAARKRIVTCEGGIGNGVRSLDRRTGRQKWLHRLDGDAQVCEVVGGQVFVGHHRSGLNSRVDRRGCGRYSCGAMGAFLRASDGRQTRWLPTTGDLSGGGRNRDGRNNGIIGATRIGPWFVVTGSFDRVGRSYVGHLAKFRVL